MPGSSAASSGRSRRFTEMPVPAIRKSYSRGPAGVVTCTASPASLTDTQGVAARIRKPGISTARLKVGSGGGWLMS
jgi:hypothetical protein